MFSHTIKGQEYNMPLLAQYVAPSSAAASAASGSSIAGGARVYPRLIDYELITGDDGKRTVGFGWFAGGALAVLLSSFFLSFFVLFCILLLN